MFWNTVFSNIAVIAIIKILIWLINIEDNYNHYHYREKTYFGD